MDLNLPAKYRKAAYIFTALLTPVVTYAQLKGYIGDVEVALWTAEVTVVSAMAALNTVTK